MFKVAPHKPVKAPHMTLLSLFREVAESIKGFRGSDMRKVKNGFYYMSNNFLNRQHSVIMLCLFAGHIL